MSFTEFPIPSVELVTVASNARNAINAMENSNDAVNNAIEVDSAATVQSLDTGGSLWSWIVGKIGAITSIVAGGNWTFGGKVLVGTAQATSAKLTVTDNTSDDAVRITQTGSGNALVVEDSPNPDNSPFTISQGGQVYIGNTTSLPSGESWPLQITGGTGSSVGCVMARFANDVAGSHALSFVKSRSGTNGSYGGIVQNGDQIGRIQFGADDGTTRMFSSTLTVSVDGEPQTGSVPSRMAFTTTPVGGGSTERMRITSAGKVGIGTSFPASKLHVSDGSSDAALTVTQTGAGDALVVQDVGGDSTPFVIDGVGRVVVGKQSVLSTTNLGTPYFQTHGTGGVASQVAIHNWDSNASNTSIIRMVKSQGGAIGTNGVLADGADLGRIQFWGDDGSDFYRGADIVAEVDGLIGQFATSLSSGISYRIKSAGTTDFTTFGAADNNVGTVFTANRDGTPSDGDGVAIKTSGDMPGRLSFWTTDDGNASPTERMRITRAGNVGVGNIAPSHRLSILNNTSTNNNAVPTIAIGTDNSAGVATIDTVRGAVSTTIGLAISTSNSGSLTEKVRVNPAGNVGINTTAPETRLHVVGDLTMQSATTATTATAGTNGDVPAQVVGYLQVKINGTNRKIPYYA